MPSRPLRQCARAGCRELGRHSHGDDRPSSSARGYDRHHQKWRLIILARDPLCVICLSKGLTVPATVADHIVPLAAGGDWSEENGQGLCATCHGEKTRAENRAFTLG